MEQTSLLLQKVHAFFEQKPNEDKLLRIYRSEPSMSLRILDWFVTNYSKRHFVVYELEVHPNGNPVMDFEQSASSSSSSESSSSSSSASSSSTSSSQPPRKMRFQVYEKYKAMLNSFGKSWFDTFSRELKQQYYDREWKRYYLISVGQLNFFKWVIEHRIMEYVEQHYEEIVREMPKSTRRTQDTPPTFSGPMDTSVHRTRKRRAELSVYSCKCMKKEDVNVTISFS